MVKRLAEITVDPNTVTLSKKVDTAAVGAPRPATDLKPGAYRYAVTVAAGRSGDGFAGNKVTGTLTMNGQPQPVSAGLGGPLFGDGGAGVQAIACHWRKDTSRYSATAIRRRRRRR